MKTRDLVIVSTGAILTFLGIFLTFAWGLAGGISALLLTSLLILILLVLERRQVAKLQERVLTILRSTTTRQVTSAEGKNSGVATDSWMSDSFDEVTIKKILGLLQAQQMSMEALDRHISTLSAREASNVE